MIKRIIDETKKVLVIMNRSQKALGIVVLLLSFLAAFLETLGVSVIIPLVNSLLNPQVLWDNEIVANLAKFFSIENDRELIVAMIIGVILVYIVKNAFFIFYSWVNVKYAYKVQRECSIEMMKSYMNRGYLFFVDHNVSELNQGVNGDVTLLYNVVINAFKVISQSLICLCICAFMAYTDWELACGVVVAAILCVVIIVFVFRKKVVRAGEEQRKYVISATKVFLEAFYGIKDVMAARSQKHYIKKFEETTIKKQRAQIIQTIGNEIPAYIIEAICIVGIMIILCIRMISMENPAGFVVTLAAFAIGAFRVLPALGKISASINSIEASLVGVNTVYENIVEARIYDSNYPVVDKKDKDVLVNNPFKAVKLDSITFSYSEELGKVLDSINLTINRGEAVAFIGESGSGKSTLTDVILGLLPLDDGKVYLDGVDIKDIPNKWSKLVGFVPQSIYLADTTVAENVAYGEDEETIDRDKVREKLKEANVLDFIDSLPDGIDTCIGDRGVKLSGGQRQRIGIARALYRNPEILILDEATSALDNDTEKSVMEAIDNLHGTLTLIIVAHRLTTIKNCDHIYEIRGGKAVERKYEEITK